jgi:hypothetical protein
MVLSMDGDLSVAAILSVDLDLNLNVGGYCDVKDLAMSSRPGIRPSPIITHANGGAAVDHAKACAPLLAVHIIPRRHLCGTSLCSGSTATLRTRGIEQKLVPGQVGRDKLGKLGVAEAWALGSISFATSPRASAGL